MQGESEGSAKGFDEQFAVGARPIALGERTAVGMVAERDGDENEMVRITRRVTAGEHQQDH